MLKKYNTIIKGLGFNLSPVISELLFETARNIETIELDDVIKMHDRIIQEQAINIKDKLIVLLQSKLKEGLDPEIVGKEIGELLLKIDKK